MEAIKFDLNDLEKIQELDKSYDLEENGYKKASDLYGSKVKIINYAGGFL